VTGVSELLTSQVVPAAPDQIRVSVLGGRTQLDVALPADVPVAAFLPELTELIRSRSAGRGSDGADVADRDERRTFWVLSRIEDGAALAPNGTLRAAGVSNGELLRISARRALSPPMLHDDVVDAAARLNRAAYAAWNPVAAKVMAFAGLWLGAAVWVIFLMADALSAHRTVVAVGAAGTAVTLIASGAVVHRVLNLSDIATAAGWPALAITAALAWVLAAPHGAGGVAVGCAILLVLTGVYYRVIGTGHWAYIAAAVIFAIGGVALVGRALGVGVEVVATVATAVAVLGCVAMPTSTARLARLPTPKVRKDRGVDDPFTPPDAVSSGAAMPSAEQVWARVRAVQLTRAGMLAGLAAVVVVGAGVLLSTRTEASALIFALACAAVLALRSRRPRTWPERAALAVPAGALTLTACVLCQAGAGPLRLAGVGVLVAVAVLAILAGLVVSHARWVSTAAAYLEYVTVAALVPLALWPLGVYDRLGLW
jgi:type VII secretion integral membrane protein EccD